MARASLPARCFAALAISAAAAMLLFASAPAHWVIEDLAVRVSGEGCPSAEVHLRAVEDPEIAARVLPVVIGDGPSAARSCELVAETVRTRAAVFEAVPRRFICERVRRWARARYEARDQVLGGPIWIVDGDAVPPLEQYDTLTALGLGYVKLGTGIALVARPR